MKKRITSFILFLNIVFVFGNVQMGIIDEVIWIVGDEAIFRSEVEEQRLRAQYEGMAFDGDPNCIISEQLAIQKLFLHQAVLDSIEVSESMVMNQVEHMLNIYIAQIGSVERLEEYFSKSLMEIRNELREMFRNQMIIQQVQRQLVGDINPTPAQVRRFYNSIPQDSIPIIPTQVEVQIISAEPPIPIEETERTKERLRGFAERVNNGTSSFSILARMYSECESAQRGGEIGFMGRAQLLPEFAAVAFNLQNDRVSRVVETEAGFHIIQLIERRGERVNTRHILLRPRVSTEDRNRATQIMDSVANLIRTDRITFEQAVLHFSQDRNTALNAGLMFNERHTGTSRFEYQHLPAEVARVVYDMNVGEISRPFSMMNPETGKELIAIVRLRSRVETRTANLRDDYQFIKSMYETKRSNEIIDEWIQRKIRETYINIDPAWMNCDFEFSDWIK